MYSSDSNNASLASKYRLHLYKIFLNHNWLIRSPWICFPSSHKKRLLKTIFRSITVGLLRFEATDQLIIFISVPVVNINSAEQATGSCIDVHIAWWCYGIETLSTLLALCEENPPITSGCPDKETLWTLLALCEGNPSIAGGFPSQRATDVGIWYEPEQAVEQMGELAVIWDSMMLV